MSDKQDNPGPREGIVWRVVEAQHRASTMKLVDNADEQRTLEELLDASKPAVPASCRHLHWLLFTPFRYQARSDSRFRRAGATAGVFYAAEHVETAVAEIAFWRLLFFIESPATPWPQDPLGLTAFSSHYKTARCLDLAAAPFAARMVQWTHPTDYTACHALADAAREQDAEAIRSISARDPHGRSTISLLSCTAFARRAPHRYQTWLLKLSPAGVYARCESPYLALQFDREAFASDPRIAAFDWKAPRGRSFS